MESSNNEKINGYLVYKRKRNQTSSEESKSYSSNAISSNLKTLDAKAHDPIGKPASSGGGDETKVSVKFSKSAVETQGGAAVSDVGDCGTVIQQTPNNIKHDKLLILRDVLERSMEQHDKPEQKTDRIQRQNPVYAQAGRPLKEKYAMLRKRQKERLALSNTSKGLPLYSRPIGSKQSSDFQMGNYDASVRSDALGYKWIGVDARQSSFTSLSRPDVSNPNTSLHIKDGSASGFTSSNSFHKNIDTETSRRPSGFLKRKDKMNDWSELELDCLWIGVRRYGHGNWNTILEDPASRRYLKNRTPEDLSMRWIKEIHKLFSPPQPTSWSLSTMPDRSIQPISDRNGFPDATGLWFSRTKVPPHPTSITRSPVAVANQNLVSTNSIHSQKFDNWGPHKRPSSSRPYHSSPQAANANAPGCLSNVNLDPMVSELLFQTLNQRANLETNVRSARMKALQTPANSVATKGQTSQTIAEPSFLLGGLYLLPKANEGDDPSDTESNPSVVDLVVESDEETDWSSGRTLSD